MPTNLRDKQILDVQIRSYQRDLYYNSYFVTRKAMVAVLIISFLFMLFVQFCPKVMNRVAVVGGIICMIGLAVCILVYKTNVGPIFKWVVFGVIVFLVILCLITFLGNWRSWGLNGVFLDYSTKFVRARLHTFMYIPLFLAFMAAFVIFQAYQYRSFWSFGKLSFNPETSIYHKFENPIFSYILSALQFVQIVWGLSFLK